jgi:hypothetical protein
MIEISLEELPAHLAASAVYNASHCILNDHLRTSPGEMSFLVFEIVRNEKSKGYFLDQPDCGHVYAILEELTGYIWSNSNRLFLELEFVRGVSQEEIDTEGNQFRSIISHLAMDYCDRNDFHIE